MSTRLYKVTVTGADDPRLVEASNQSQAIRHVASGMIQAAPASALETAQLIAAGVVVEAATAQKGGDDGQRE